MHLSRFYRITVLSARGRVWEKREDIEREIVHFFKKLYSSDNRSRPQMDGVSFRQLSRSHISFLEGHFRKEEIKEAVFGLGNDRVPGPDGFPIAFFHHFWKLFEDDLLVFFDEFHANGVLNICSFLGFSSIHVE